MPANLADIRASFRSGAYNITTHGFDEMWNDGVTVTRLKEAIADDCPRVIEDYELDPRGASCLVVGKMADGQPLHACIGYAGTQPVVITVYRPDPNLWLPGFARRRKRKRRS